MNPVIHSTTDYSQFTLIPGNRPINPNHVKHLIDSISKDNKLALNPMIVTQKKEVIDGQHRLEACIKRSWEIFYIVDDKTHNTNGILSTVQQLQIAKPWSQMDYLSSYISQGKTDYEVLQHFMVRYDQTLKNSMRMLFIPKNDHDRTYLFKTGYFVCNNRDNADIIGSRLLDMKGIIADNVRRDREFINALQKVYQFVSHKDLLPKIRDGKSQLQFSTKNMKLYLRILEDIYNYHRKHIVRFY